MAQNIEDIICTDKKAREIVQKAQDCREAILSTAEKERDRIIDDGKTKLENLKISLQVENEAFENSLKADNDKVLNAKKQELLTQYEANEDKWVNEVFTRITANI